VAEELGATPADEEENPRDEEGATTGDEAEQEAALAEDLSAPIKALRGAFQLAPQRARRTPDSQPQPETAPPQAWELWWVPLPPRREADSAVDAEPTPIGRPYKVCSNIRALRWRMFDDRAFKTAHSAIWTSSLPAYIELQVETTAGLKADWLFEVDWSVGPEVPKSTADASAANAEGADKGAGKDGDQGSGPNIPGKPSSPAPGKSDGQSGSKAPIGPPS
jgi:hypothetical protein